MPAPTLRLRRIGEFLTPERIRAYSGMLLAAEILMSIYFVAATHGLTGPLVAPVTTDFVSFYAAGSLADAGTPELAYDRAAHYAAEQRAREPGIEYNYFYYPPVFLLLCSLLARLPYLPAFLLFEAVTLGFYLAASLRILGGWRWTSLAPLLAFPPLFWNFGLGQNGFLTAALFAAATLTIDRRPVTAGLLFGALCYKPHLGLLVPVALAAGRRWRAFAAAAASAAGLVLLSGLLFGVAIWRDYLAAALASPATYETGKAKLEGFVTPFGAAVMLGGSPSAAYAVQAAVTLAAAGFVAIVWYRDAPLPVRAAALASATLIAVPVALYYELLLAAVAMVWLCRDGEGLAAGEKLAVACCFLALLHPAGFSQALGLPIGAVAAFGAVAITARHAFGGADQTAM